MFTQPKDIIEKLEFEKVLDLLAKECYGDIGREKALTLPFSTQAVLINKTLAEVKSFKTCIEEKYLFPFGKYNDLSADLKMLEKEGYVLPIEGLLRIHAQLVLIKAIFQFFNPTRIEQFPKLYDIIRDTNLDKDLQKAIDEIIDDEGEIRPNASPELLRIHRLKQSKSRELDTVFRRLVAEYRKNDWLADNVESFRNGRRVLAVPVEHKRKIRGIIHDESVTGRTTFIEPDAIIQINNEIFDLEADFRHEVYRLLRTLSATLRPYTPLLANYQEIVIRFDLIQAKARLAMRMNADMPKVEESPCFELKEAIHPLLYLKNKAENKKTVPFDIVLHGSNRILVLSGPNAGGKSITMKAIGLLQMMVQAGFLIPADPSSRMGVFKQIFADIGDQQSLEDDLSTYSSRLKNMKAFMDFADKDTLVLIDEFGSGTDPKIGGAIAEAILRDLNYKKIFGVITTHYSNLKMYAFKNKGIVNGSMYFDKKSLSPTYELKIGRPGSSYAFEIAEKSGLDNRVLNYAKHKTGKNEKAVDQLLVDLQAEKKDLEDQFAQTQERQEKLDKLIKSYERMSTELEYARKKIKLEAKQKALASSAQQNKDLERVIREIKEAQNIEKAKALAIEAKQRKTNLAEEVENLNEDIYYKPSQKIADKATLEVGSFVKMRMGGTSGKIISIDKKQAIVQVGEMHMVFKIKDLLPAKEPLDIKREKGIQTETYNNAAKFESKIDLRGMMPTEALATLEKFVDEAIISHTMTVRIIHGKGTGVLRKIVRKKLREYSDISQVYHPEPHDGGDGVTIADFE